MGTNRMEAFFDGVVAILVAFLSPWISLAIYVLVALIWIVPDRRIERVLEA